MSNSSNPAGEAFGSEPETVNARRPGLALVVIGAAQLMVMLDMTIVNIALPAMQRALGFSTVNLEWVVTAYVLVFGGMLLFGGRLGDLYGPRRLFMIGIAIFAFASLAGGLATDQAWLIAARALQGMGAAIASPTALALVSRTFPDGPRRHRAMAVYAAMAGAGGLLGLLLSGILIDIGSWRWVMLVNVPIAVALLVAAPLALSVDSGHKGRLDVPGAISASGGLALLVYGLSRAASAGWSDALTLTAFALAAALLVSFVVIERRSDHALLPFRILANRTRVGGYVLMVVLGAEMLSMIYFLSQDFQDVRHYSPIIAGLAFMPAPLVFGAVGGIASRLVRVIGTRPLLTAGPLVVAAGLAWLSQMGTHSSYAPSVLGPLIVFGVGMGLSFVPLTLNAVTGVAHNDTGLAAALLDDSQQVGGALGLAVLVTIAATSAAHLAHGASYGTAAVGGYDSAFRAGAIAAAIAFAAVLALVRNSGKSGTEPTVPT
ncbi:MFS transporter [Ferrimicrobium sp.]|uniref:MFS transporter n=1 Tax=Ferrimicrobium sp. TaxID=2926050 RepID=UPI0026302D4B|nr:MFS transporter [Ferrimicrobium sp.]